MNLILALDTQDKKKAKACLLLAEKYQLCVKVGHASLEACPLEVWQERKGKLKLFLDFKLHDIPTTLKKATKHYIKQLPNLHFLTYWGLEEASTQAILETCHHEGKTLPLAVIELTSEEPNESSFLRKVEHALSWGAKGFITPPSLLSSVRNLVGKDVVLVSPGVRLFEPNEHQNPKTPQQAKKDGADWIVVGRPIVDAQNQEEALKAYLNP